MPELVTSIAALRNRTAAARREGKSIGLVPTMGALHQGHRSLLALARAQTGIVVATIFVNPTQFNNPHDLEVYPRTLEEDLVVCEREGADFVFAPPAREMYPGEQLTWVDVPDLTRALCGPGRPGHFRGVATVVMKLFQIAQADRAYFGEKDAQQLAVIRRMVRDLNVPIEIVLCPTVREPDGLAMSSRNRRLTPEQRRTAAALSQALFAARDAVHAGETSAARITADAGALLARHQDIRVEYFSIVDPETLGQVEEIREAVLIAGAVWLGQTRLIDNVAANQI